MADRIEERVRRLMSGRGASVWARSPSPPAARDSSSTLPPQRVERAVTAAIRAASPAHSSSSSSSSSSSEARRRRKKEKKREKKAKKEAKKENKRRRKESEPPAVDPPRPTVAPPAKGGGEDSEEEDFGPAPAVQLREERRVNYGGALLPGEGSRIAEYVQQNLRVPRRGEIGWSGDAIGGLEQQGYVMSGERHARMTAVRLRKENQVYSAEEKKALAMLAMQERQEKNEQVIGEFRALLHDKLEASGKLKGTAPP